MFSMDSYIDCQGTLHSNAYAKFIINWTRSKLSLAESGRFLGEIFILFDAFNQQMIVNSIWTIKYTRTNQCNCFLHSLHLDWRSRVHQWDFHFFRVWHGLVKQPKNFTVFFKLETAYSWAIRQPKYTFKMISILLVTLNV